MDSFPHRLLPYTSVRKNKCYGLYGETQQCPSALLVSLFLDVYRHPCSEGPPYYVGSPSPLFLSIGVISPIMMPLIFFQRVYGSYTVTPQFFLLSLSPRRESLPGDSPPPLSRPFLALSLQLGYLRRGSPWFFLYPSHNNTLLVFIEIHSLPILGNPQVPPPPPASSQTIEAVQRRFRTVFSLQGPSCSRDRERPLQIGDVGPPSLAPLQHLANESVSPPIRLRPKRPFSPGSLSPVPFL